MTQDTNDRLTLQIAEWVARGASMSPSPDDERMAGMGFRDCVACIHAGWNARPATDLRRIHGLAEWTDPLRPLARPVGDLAMHLAFAAHIDDFDDTAFGGHVSAVLVPALLAAVAHQPVSGRRMLTAYLAGYETWAELSSRERDSVHGKGWHPSGVYGPVAAAAAISSLRGLTGEETTTALSLAASMAGGLVAQFGSWAKPWQVGRAAQAGIHAVDLSRAGMQASVDALEHPMGFLTAISPRGATRRNGPAGLGRHMVANGLNIKRYPVCYAMHRALDGAENLRRQPGFDLAAVTAIEVTVGESQAAILRYVQPETVAEAKFSLQFGISLMLLRGHCYLSDLTDETVRSPEIRRLIPLVSVRTRQGRHDAEPSFAPWDDLSVTLHDGRRFETGPIVSPIGHFLSPASPEVLDEKVHECLSAGAEPKEVERIGLLLERVNTLCSTADLITIKVGECHDGDASAS